MRERQLADDLRVDLLVDEEPVMVRFGRRFSFLIENSNLPVGCDDAVGTRVRRHILIDGEEENIECRRVEWRWYAVAGVCVDACPVVLWEDQWGVKGDSE